MKHLRKFWVSLMLLFSVDTYAISIDLVPNQTHITSGGIVSIAVNISGLKDGGAPSLGAYDLDFHFDNTLFSFNSLIWGDNNKGNQLDLAGFGSLQDSSENAGWLNLLEISFDDALNLDFAQAGEFTLFSVVLNAVGIGSGNFSLTANSLSDSFGNALETSNINNTHVNVGNSVTVPEPSSLLLFAGLLAMVLLRKKLAQK